jgi:glutamine synthetase adenylyltransferase
MKRCRKQIYLLPEQNEELSKLSLATGRSESSIVREALSEYLTKVRKKANTYTNPLSKLLELKVESEVADGSEQHDRDIYEAPGRDLP